MMNDGCQRQDAHHSTMAGKHRNPRPPRATPYSTRVYNGALCLAQRFEIARKLLEQDPANQTALSIVQRLGEPKE